MAGNHSIPYFSGLVKSINNIFGIINFKSESLFRFCVCLFTFNALKFQVVTLLWFFGTLHWKLFAILLFNWTILSRDNYWFYLLTFWIIQFFFLQIENMYFTSISLNHGYIVRRVVIATVEKGYQFIPILSNNIGAQDTNIFVKVSKWVLKIIDRDLKSQLPSLKYTTLLKQFFVYLIRDYVLLYTVFLKK